MSYGYCAFFNTVTQSRTHITHTARAAPSAAQVLPLFPRRTDASRGCSGSITPAKSAPTGPYVWTHAPRRVCTLRHAPQQAAMCVVFSTRAAALRVTFWVPGRSKRTGPCSRETHVPPWYDLCHAHHERCENPWTLFFITPVQLLPSTPLLVRVDAVLTGTFFKAAGTLDTSSARKVHLCSLLSICTEWIVLVISRVVRNSCLTTWLLFPRVVPGFPPVAALFSWMFSCSSACAIRT